MITSFWITMLIIVIGLILVILPDHDRSLFNFNKDHGPSLQDVLGLMLIVLSWCFILFRIILKRNRILKSIGTKNTVLLVMLIIAGTVLIISGLQIERDLILWVGVLLSVFAYSILLTPAFRKN